MWGGGREQEKVDLPVAQLLAIHSHCYLLRLESPVSQGRIVEEAEYVTGDRQVSDRATGEDAFMSISEQKKKKKKTLCGAFMGCYASFYGRCFVFKIQSQ